MTGKRPTSVAVASSLGDVLEEWGQVPSDPLLSEHTRMRLAEGIGVVIAHGEPTSAILTLVPGKNRASGLVEVSGVSLASRRMAWAALSPEVFEVARDRGITELLVLDRDHIVTGGVEVDAVVRMSTGLSSVLSVDTGETASERDLPELLELNNRAFAGHPENGNWSLLDLEDRVRQPWFRWGGLLVAGDEGSLSGFCWTKIHSDGVGEIYVLAVDPEAAGEGLGSSLASRGLSYLKDQAAAGTAIVYTSKSNEAALGLYRRLGFETDRETRRLRFDDL